ncbi:MAG TPA: DNA recombination protein RmuC [Acidimicrobiales bacterium]|nr:DNA recombination protein RmuC [Acidimicrobiales bacterium]
MTTWLAVGAAAGALVGVVATVLALAGRSAAQLAAAEVEHARTRADLMARVARSEAAVDQERAAAAERQLAWDEARRQLTGEFAELSTKALQQNNAQFLELADARLKETQQAATGDLEQRKQAIEQLLSPLREQLGKYEDGIRLLELERQKAYTGLSEQVRVLSESQDRLQGETRNLVTALRAPSTRGRWGEMQLRRVVEMAGMLEHCDFDEQVTATGEDGRMRPDMVVRLPGGRSVVVDAKVPLQAFLDANEATDDDSRRSHLAQHARQLRAHIDALSKKAYWQQFDRSPEYVVAFVPGDPLLAAAFEHDPLLFEHAMANHVLVATPTSLIALLRNVASSWQQEALAENAREVQKIGRDLYKRLSTFGEHLARTGRGLAGAVDAYNKAVGSLERSVLPQARRFQELGVVGAGDKELAEVGEVDVVARRPQTPELTTALPALELVVEDLGEPDLPDAVEG